MKKIMAFLTMFMLVIPLMNVLAIEGNYYTYTVGDQVNFYTYSGDEVGTTTTIISDEGANSKYVRVLATGFAASISPYSEAIDGDPTSFKNTFAYKRLLTFMNDPIGTGTTFEYAKPLEQDGNLNLITLDELKKVFNATSTDNGATYTIDASKWAKTFEVIGTSATGMYTQTVEDGKVWIVKFDYDNDTDRNIKAIKVEQEPIDTDTMWALVPVIYLDKTYDCIERTVTQDYACYACNDDYTWTKVGTQDESCKLVDTVNKKADCVKGPQTGIQDYLFEIMAIIAICGIALVIVKKKELFRNI